MKAQVDDSVSLEISNQCTKGYKSLNANLRLVLLTQVSK
jgi:hypothetical protein